MKTLPTILLTVVIAIPATWFVSRQFAAKPPPATNQASKSERKVLFYQSAMHPWIKSDKPGRCTICGMELTPVYEGDAGFDSAGGAVVSLTQTMIQALNVETVEVSKRPLTRTLSVAGTLDDNATRHRVLSAYTPGRIEKLYINFVGAEVKEGQPLAEFYSPNLLQSEREYRSLSGELRQATAVRLRQMGLTPAQIGEIPNKHSDKLTSQILAPIGGTVVLQNIYEGQYVQEGEKLFEIADFSIMWFQFFAYEQDLSWLKPGLKVDVTTASTPGKTFSGTITFIDPNLDESTRSAKVRVELENPIVDGRRLLLHRLYADGSVQVEAPEVLAIPRTAVIQGGAQPIVYVAQSSGAYARRVVKIGRRGDEFVEILSGLEAGEKVVTNGNLLIDGQAEMNRSFAETAHEEMENKRPGKPLTEPERKALTQFIKANEDVSRTLAKDDLTGFKTAASIVMSATDGLIAALKSRTDLKDILTHVDEAKHLHATADLASARKAFHPFANASAKALEMLRDTEGAPGFQVFECPMVDKAIPGAPNRGRWVQAADRPIANPYFGAAMIDCGKRIIP